MDEKTTDIDFREISDHICKLLSRWSAPTNWLGELNRWHIRVQIGKGKKSGKVKYTFYTRDEIYVEIDVDVADFLRNPNDYMGATVMQLVEYMNRTRADRGPLILSADGLSGRGATGSQKALLRGAKDAPAGSSRPDGASVH